MFIRYVTSIVCLGLTSGVVWQAAISPSVPTMPPESWYQTNTPANSVTPSTTVQTSLPGGLIKTEIPAEIAPLRQHSDQSDTQSNQTVARIEPQQTPKIDLDEAQPAFSESKPTPRLIPETQLVSTTATIPEPVSAMELADQDPEASTEEPQASPQDASLSDQGEGSASDDGLASSKSQDSPSEPDEALPVEPTALQVKSDPYAELQAQVMALSDAQIAALFDFAVNDRSRLGAAADQLALLLLQQEERPQLCLLATEYVLLVNLRHAGTFGPVFQAYVAAALRQYPDRERTLRFCDQVCTELIARRRTGEALIFSQAARGHVVSSAQRNWFDQHIAYLESCLRLTPMTMPAPQQPRATTPQPLVEPTQDNRLGRLLDFEGRTLAGNTYNFRSLRGRWVVVIFWKSSCSVCQDLIPGLSQVYRKLDRNKVEFLSICSDPSADRARGFVEEYQIRWPQLSDQRLEEHGQTASIREMLHIESVPRILLVDPQGKVQLDNVPSLEELERELDLRFQAD